MAIKRAAAKREAMPKKGVVQRTKKKAAAKPLPKKEATATRKAAPAKRSGKAAAKGTAAKRRSGAGSRVLPAGSDSAALAMMPPPSGVKIRMYRQGHGDCFLLAFRQDDGEPFYQLIDCGMKKGSTLVRSMTEVAQSIHDATGGHLNLVTITHEHEDHVSGFLSEKAIFEKLAIDKLWLAWTEDPKNDLANQLREKYGDTLLGLVAASERLQGARNGADATVRDVVDSLLELELSGEDRRLAARSPAKFREKIAGRTNKEGIVVVKRQADARQGTEYLRPHSEPRLLPNVSGVRFFVCGPPEHEAKLRDMDPKGEEEFHFAAAEERSFLAAVAAAAGTSDEQEAYQPFEPRHRIPAGAAGASEHGEFFEKYYGLANDHPERHEEAWRKIDTDWLGSSEAFALRMSNFINNTSLVLAIELPRTKKVLLFVGDAQRGNWVSWAEKSWTAANGLTGDEEVTVADLLHRTVFYKVGHHGSHNATMNQGGLREMAQGELADQFVAMIPANEKWALAVKPKPWVHPLPAIYKALLEKAKGRVFVMDRDLQAPDPQVLSPAKWQQFLDRSVCNDLYYELIVED